MAGNLNSGRSYPTTTVQGYEYQGWQKGIFVALDQSLGWLKQALILPNDPPIGVSCLLQGPKYPILPSLMNMIFSLKNMNKIIDAV